MENSTQNSTQRNELIELLMKSSFPIEGITQEKHKEDCGIIVDAFIRSNRVNNFIKVCNQLKRLKND